jgi:hypothetical protein
MTSNKSALWCIFMAIGILCDLMRKQNMAVYEIPDGLWINLQGIFFGLAIGLAISSLIKDKP